MFGDIIDITFHLVSDCYLRVIAKIMSFLVVLQSFFLFDVIALTNKLIVSHSWIGGTLVLAVE